MDTLLREFRRSDFPFLREMLYEGVFWRESENRPSFEEGLAYPEVSKALAGWGERDGDTAVIATLDDVSVGAAWYRFWTDDDSVIGYVDAGTPVLAIAVHRDHRHRGIGRKMVEWLIDRASSRSIRRISLSVSKDNVALELYRQQGFRVHADRGDAFTMVRSLNTSRNA